ncbi:MAG: DUF1501 domain-containing protein [Anaerolineae bacterium]
MTIQLTRRGFLVGCSSAIAALAGARVTNLAFSAPNQATSAYNNEILVQVFLRGGWDALNVVPPLGGTDRAAYVAARDDLVLPTSGTGALLNLDAQFGLHPAMAPLFSLYQAQHLAFIHAVGLNNDTRSHFDAMQFIELGTPGNKATNTGWITRHLQSATNLPPTILIPAVATGGGMPTSLLNSTEAVSMTSPSSFDFAGYWKYEYDQRLTLRRMFDGDTWLFKAGLKTLDTVDIVEAANPGTYAPANGAVYPSGEFGDELKAIAQMIKMNIGMRVATIDLGGWDTHEYEGNGSTGYMAGLLGTLAQGLTAFYTDLNGSGCANYTSHLTVVVMSEFGRRLRENASHGTDHGHGSVMLVLGGNVKGGKVYGQWPGLSNAQLYDGNDLAVTTDYRRVLSEILMRRLGNANLAAVFPGYSLETPLDFVVDGYPVAPPPPPGLNNKVYMPLVSSPDVPQACPY